MIPYGKQDISEEDILAVENVLRSSNLTQGPAVPKFEQAVIAHCNAKYAVALNMKLALSYALELRLRETCV